MAIDECEPESATPVKAIMGTSQDYATGWLITILAHNGHYHVAASQSTAHETVSDAEDYVQLFLNSMPDFEWEDATERMPTDTEPILIESDSDG